MKNLFKENLDKEVVSANDAYHKNVGIVEDLLAQLGEVYVITNVKRHQHPRELHIEVYHSHNKPLDNVNSGDVKNINTIMIGMGFNLQGKA